eukprot:5032159-Lingulodinium_polyedra.AAC.1
MAHASAVAEAIPATPPKQRERMRRLRVEAEQLVSLEVPTESCGGLDDIHGSGGRRVALLACAKH